jgi:hypothetical protein
MIQLARPGAALLHCREANAILQAKYFRPMSSDIERLLGQVHGGNGSAMASEIHCVSADSASYFEDFLSTPLLELGESGDVRLDGDFLASTSSKYSRDPTGLGECLMLQGQRFQNSRTRSTGTVSKSISADHNVQVLVGNRDKIPIKLAVLLPN